MKVEFITTSNIYSNTQTFGTKPKNKKKKSHNTQNPNPNIKAIESNPITNNNVEQKFYHYGPVEHNQKINYLQKNLVDMLSTEIANTHKSVDKYVKRSSLENIDKYDEKGKLLYRLSNKNSNDYVTFYKYNDKGDVTQELCYSSRERCIHITAYGEPIYRYIPKEYLEYEYQKDFAYQYDTNGNKRQIIKVFSEFYDFDRLNCTVTNLDSDGNVTRKIEGGRFHGRPYVYKLTENNPKEKTGFHCIWYEQQGGNYVTQQYGSYEYDRNGIKNEVSGCYDRI